MKHYQKTKSGSYDHDNRSIPDSSSNRHYQEMISEVEKGLAEILPYTEPEISLDDIRAQREILFKEHVDKYNPSWWSELTTDQKDKINNYRALLKDITSQDPAKVSWPVAPDA